MIITLTKQEIAEAERLAMEAAVDPDYEGGALFYSSQPEGYKKKLQGFCGELMVAKFLNGWKVPPEKSTTLFDVIDEHGKPHEVKTVLAADRIKKDIEDKWGPMVPANTYKSNMPTWYVEIMGAQDYSNGSIECWEWSDNIWAMGEDITVKSLSLDSTLYSRKTKVAMRLPRSLCQPAPDVFTELTSPWALRDLAPWQKKHLELCFDKYGRAGAT